MCTELCIDTSTLTRLLTITLTVAGVVTAIGATDGVPLVELTVRTTVTCGVSSTSVGVSLTSITEAIATTILTVL